ncbi:S1 family peptidase [Streptomyces violascens]|uniref:S1 family peptidase n=1 Tax=Streptomyces violascens TaxID=67381 RepID=UPI0037AB5E8B
MKSALLSRSLCAAALGLGLLAGAATPAGAAQPTTAEARAVQLMKRQQPLLDAAHHLRQSGAAALPGFAGITVDPERATLRLYWRGDLPARVQQTVRHLKRPAVRIEVRRPAERPGASRATAQPAGRANDGAPVSGGALIITRAETCTTGFGVLDKATGKPRLLTAGHCGPVGTPWFNGDGEFLGNAVAVHPEADAQVIDANGTDRVWHGAVDEQLDGVDDTSRPVTDARTPEVGQYLCTSGAVSGTHCGLRVTRTGLVLSIAGHDVPDQIEAEQVDRTASIGNGDSGAPVYSATTARGPVTAHGMITAYDRAETASCTGAPTGQGRACSWRVYFTDIQTVLRTTDTRLPPART